jgi:lipoyl(octanoyl) transferase
LSSSTEFHRSTPARRWTYADLDRRQREVHSFVLAGGEGKILFSELAPVITLGLREVAADFTESPESLARRGIEVFRTTRGGRATYHGPGQWVVFPVDSLERLTGDRKGVRKASEALLQAGLEVCSERFPHAEIREGCEAGVWSGPGAEGAKVVAMGLRFDRGILQHGISVNVFATPESFSGIRPCGLTQPVGFLEADTPGDAVFMDWGQRIERSVRRRFPSFS